MRDDGLIAELVLLDGLSAPRIQCAPGVVPAPGQYVLAHAHNYDEPLATALFMVQQDARGFVASPPAPDSWRPGARVHLRGPLGNGFALPPAARRVALVASDDQPRRLLALVGTAIQQGASVTLLCDDPPDDLSLQVEIQPLRALESVLRWSDYAALDVARESLPGLTEKLVAQGVLTVGGQAQVLVRTPMPCGGLAECGVCTVPARGDSRLACENGPVFDLKLLALER